MTGNRKKNAARERCSIRDLAQYVGLSTCTVSKVLNGRTGTKIPEATRERVFAAARELDYVPNVNAQRLFRRRAGVIGLLVPSQLDAEDHVFTDLHFVDILAGMEETLQGSGSNLLLLFGEKRDANCRYWPLFRAGTVDGLLVWGEHREAGYLGELLENRAPTLFITSVPDSAAAGQLSFVTAAYRRTAAELTGILCARNPRRLLFLCGPGAHSVVEATRAGVEDALAGTGIECTVLASRYAHESARQNLLGALLREKFDGLIVMSRSMESGVQEALRELEIAPGRLPMVILDGDRRTGLAAGVLGAARLDDREIGRLAIQGIRQLIDRETECFRREVRPELLIAGNG